MEKAGRASRTLVYALCGLPVLLLIQRAAIRTTNFGGFDEWPLLDLSSRLIVDSASNSSRPLGLLWLVPSQLHPRSFEAFGWLSFLYLALTALLLFRMCRRLLPEFPRLAFIAASVCLVWAPGDLSRLSTVECALYAGITFGAMAALAILVESWFNGSRLQLALACVLAFAVVRSYEGTLAVLACAPLLLLATRTERRRLALWCGAWVGFLLASAAFAVAPLVWPPDASYQVSVLKPEMDPRVLAGRVGWQYIYHLAPLVLSPARELANLPVGLAVVLFAGLFALARHGSSDLESPAPRRALVASAGIGLLFAGLGYCLVVSGTAAPTAFRLQFLSGPGMAVALASVVVGIGAIVPRAASEATALALAAWIVAVGTGRTVAMQQTWDRESAYPAQMSMLRGLVAAAPDLRPGTMVLLLDDGKAWRATFGFHHAIRYLYEGRAAGCVWGAWDALYPATLGRAGLHSEPWRVIRSPWGVGPHDYRYDEMVVARFAGGRVEVLTEWPAELPPVPADARYAPRSRILDLSRPVPERRILP